MKSAAQCRIKATVRPEMSVPKSLIDMLMHAAEQMNASATELTKKTLMGEEHLDYLERARGKKQMGDDPGDPAAFEISRSSILPRAEAEENFCDSGNQEV